MQVQESAKTGGVAPREGAWSAVLAMSLVVFTLIASEFMPISLLTPIATDLVLTEGQAGQAIAVSGIFAVLTSLFITEVAARWDRRSVLLSLTGLMMLSGLVVAFAPDYTLLMVGRALLGIVIGGFWSMSAATVMRLVPDASVPKALAILNGGNALATTIAAPLGSFLGSLIGWRGAFFCVVPIAAVALAWQFKSLPAMNSAGRPRRPNVFRLLARREVAFGMGAMAFLFMGQFALFTYLRPFLESVTRVDAAALSFILLAVGVSGFVGTMLIGALLHKSVFPVLVAIPLLMALVAVALILYGANVPATTLLLGTWGLLGTAAPVGWWTWLARTLPDDADAGGGMMVATVQLAITFGAIVGGMVFDATGYQATFAVSALLLVLGGLLTLLASPLVWRRRASRAGSICRVAAFNA
jgi:predicted MFS family arabinose efflux permease